MAAPKSDEGAAITAIGRALDLVDDPAARDRILDWALKKFGTARLADGDRQQNGGKAARRAGSSAVNAESTTGDLFESADPQTDQDRILVVGYWLHKAKASADFDSQTVNTELKSLGYGLTNVNKKFDSVVAKRPQLIRQTAKSGKSKQARKRYRLTAEGEKRVETLLRGENPDNESK